VCRKENLCEQVLTVRVAAVGLAVFLQRPTAKDVNAFLGRTIRAVGNKSRCVITDKGKQF